MKTVKVRIAVAVDPEGDWDARGGSGLFSQDRRVLRALAYQENTDAVYWLTAELPVPEAQEIAATVEEAKP